MELHSYAKLRATKKWSIEQKRKLVEARISYDPVFVSKPTNSVLPWKVILSVAKLDDYNVFFVRQQWANMVSRYKQYKQSRLGNIPTKAIDDEMIRKITEEWEFFEPIHRFMTRKTTNLHSYALTMEPQAASTTIAANAQQSEQANALQQKQQKQLCSNSSTEHINNSSDTNEDYEATTAKNNGNGKSDIQQMVQNTDHDFYSKKYAAAVAAAAVNNHHQQQQSNYSADASDDNTQESKPIIELLTTPLIAAAAATTTIMENPHNITLMTTTMTTSTATERLKKRFEDVKIATTQTTPRAALAAAITTNDLNNATAHRQQNPLVLQRQQQQQEPQQQQQQAHININNNNASQRLKPTIRRTQREMYAELSERDKYYRHKRRFNRRLEQRFDAVLNVFGQIVKAEYPSLDVSPLMDVANIATASATAGITKLFSSSDEDEEDDDDADVDGDAEEDDDNMFHSAKERISTDADVQQQTKVMSEQQQMLQQVFIKNENDAEAYKN